ncbi:GNAT family N-acetyltransferase [Aquiflexum gelatinilyticum]|uniref:GNAT family N-acetyltransferase n=1 Tax=Aquiflexum gelatinilyticum TaxID=2961943 RepID=UPI002167B200|nr:GNAT family N-acetyltransferase [Aquiflexum gelatinilyticum]MCS4433778.1 GNAT family N-acetyltransferase [Aquiflexum gelatinilyticum]
MYTIREGKIEDLPRVLELVKELALYEKAPEQVTNTLEMMQEDGFGPNPIFGLFVAEKNSTGEIIGISIFYYRYSTWKGKRLYLEDIVVTETERGHGAGKLLFDRTMLKCIEANCTGMMWQVLDWNTPAINFYQKYGSELDSGWINCNLQSEDIKKIL